MILNLVKGTGFRGAADYVLKKENATLIGGTMAGSTPRELSGEAAEFRKMNLKLGKAILHSSISLADGESLDDYQWGDLAEKYMEKMGFSESAYFVARHHDSDHDHIHIVGLRMNYDGKTFSDSNDYKKGEAIMRDLEKEYGLYQVNSHRMRRAPTRAEIEMASKTDGQAEISVKLQLQPLLDEALKNSPSVVLFCERLEAVGVDVAANVASTGKMNGFAFELNGHRFTGSKLGKKYGWAGLQKQGVTYEQDRDIDELRRRKGTGKAAGDHQLNASSGNPGDVGKEHGRRSAESDQVSSGIGKRDNTNTNTESGRHGRENRTPSSSHGSTGRGYEGESGYAEKNISVHGESNYTTTGENAKPVRSKQPASGTGRLSHKKQFDAHRGEHSASSLENVRDSHGIESGNSGASDRIYALAVPVDKKLPKDHYAKVMEWRKQHKALASPAYRITIKQRRQGDWTKNVGKGKNDASEVFFTGEMVERLIPQLRRENAMGADIYITPISDEEHYLVLDDTTLSALADLQAEVGVSPCLVQESSKNNVQAVFRVQKRDHGQVEQSLANEIVQDINQRCGDSKFSGAIHPFRMAGFSNAKPEKEVNGQRPLTRIIHAISHVCQVMNEWLQNKRDTFKENQAMDEQRVYEKIILEQSGDAIKAFQSVWRNHYSLAVSKGWDIDFSVIGVP